MADSFAPFIGAQGGRRLGHHAIAAICVLWRVARKSDSIDSSSRPAALAVFTHRSRLRARRAWTSGGGPVGRWTTKVPTPWRPSTSPSQYVTGRKVEVGEPIALGLVEGRQGVGTFVVQRPTGPPPDVQAPPGPEPRAVGENRQGRRVLDDEPIELLLRATLHSTQIAAIV